jgi:uncharacterized membrane protein
MIRALRDRFQPEQLQALGIASIGVMLLIVSLVVPAVAFDVPEVPPVQGPTEKATVISVTETGVTDSPRGRVHQQRIQLRLEGRTVTVERTLLSAELRFLPLQPGDEVLLAPFGDAPDSYTIVDHARGNNLLILAAGFILVVLLVARSHGAWSLIGLGASLLVIVRFIIPGILAGYDPPIIAFIGALAIMCTTLFLAHGMNLKTTVALAGTAASLLLAIILSDLGIDFAKLSGLITEEATTLNLLTEGAIDARGLLLAGVIIGTLGVLDDVTVAQASAVYELRAANHSLKQTELFRRGMNVGRDHIAATVNTLFLAYTGAALPLLIILATQSQSLGSIAGEEVVATEIVRSLIGGIVITLAVPVTTLLAAVVASRITPERAMPTPQPTLDY